MMNVKKIEPGIAASRVSSYSTFIFSSAFGEDVLLHSLVVAPDLLKRFRVNTIKIGPEALSKKNVEGDFSFDRVVPAGTLLLLSVSNTDSFDHDFVGVWNVRALPRIPHAAP